MAMCPHCHNEKPFAAPVCHACNNDTPLLFQIKWSAFSVFTQLAGMAIIGLVVWLIFS